MIAGPSQVDVTTDPLTSETFTCFNPLTPPEFRERTIKGPEAAD